MTTSIKNIPFPTACRIHFQSIFCKQCLYQTPENVAHNGCTARCKKVKVWFAIRDLINCTNASFPVPGITFSGWGHLKSTGSSFKDNRYIIRCLDWRSFISSNLAYWALAYSIAICPEMVSWLENPTSMDLWLQTWVFLGFFFSFWGFPECSVGGVVTSLCAHWQVNYGMEDDEQVRWDLLHLKTRSVAWSVLWKDPRQFTFFYHL